MPFDIPGEFLLPMAQERSINISATIRREKVPTADVLTAFNKYVESLENTLLNTVSFLEISTGVRVMAVDWNLGESFKLGGVWPAEKIMYRNILHVFTMVQNGSNHVEFASNLDRRILEGVVLMYRDIFLKK